MITTALPEDALRERTQSTYKGPFVIGRDLTSFTLNDGRITVQRADGSTVEPFKLQ